MLEQRGKPQLEGGSDIAVNLDSIGDKLRAVYAGYLETHESLPDDFKERLNNFYSTFNAYRNKAKQGGTITAADLEACQKHGEELILELQKLSDYAFLA